MGWVTAAAPLCAREEVKVLKGPQTSCLACVHTSDRLLHQPRMRLPFVECISRSFLVAMDFCVYTHPEGPVLVTDLDVTIIKGPESLWAAQGASQGHTELC